MSTVKLGSLVELSGPSWMVLSAAVVLAGSAVAVAYFDSAPRESARAARD